MEAQARSHPTPVSANKPSKRLGRGEVRLFTYDYPYVFINGTYLKYF